jgi:DNA-directed RNA polymerase specialized sigma24 family protein
MTPAERRFEALATGCGPRVLAYLARRTTPREDAADVYQEVLTTTWRKVHHAPEPDDEALAWMLAIARRTLANHRRSALGSLGEDDREVLLLLLEGLTGDQVAAVVGAGGATTRKRIQRARERLAAALEAAGAVPVPTGARSAAAPRG